MDDVVAMERLFIIGIVVVFFNYMEYAKTYAGKVQRINRIQQLVIGFKQDTTKSMAKDCGVVRTNI